MWNHVWIACMSEIERKGERERESQMLNGERKWSRAKVDLDIQEIDGHWQCKELIYTIHVIHLPFEIE